VEAVPQALAAYDKLFPIRGGWWDEWNSWKIRLLKLYPSPFRGVGANYRRLVPTKDHKFSSLRLEDPID
jgi:hypothetical protein